MHESSLSMSRVDLMVTLIVDAVDGTEPKVFPACRRVLFAHNWYRHIVVLHSCVVASTDDRVVDDDGLERVLAPCRMSCRIRY